MIVTEQAKKEINHKNDAGSNYIKKQNVTMVGVSNLEPHPSNRPLGKNPDKIEQLKESIRQYGFYSSQPLTIRLLNGKYQIIKGEHRYIAAKELGFTELPCVIEEMSDKEALIQLIIGNIQTENKPLEIGLNALEVVHKNSQNGFSAKAYAAKIGLNEKTIQRYINAATVYKYIQKNDTGVVLLDETVKLTEIYRCPQSDWVWLHNMVVEKELSRIQVGLVCKKVKEIDSITDIQELRDLFKIEQVKKKAASEALEDRNRAISNIKPALERANEFYQSLEPEAVFYDYDISEDRITGRTVNMHELFICELTNQNNLSKSTVNKAIEEVLRKKQMSSRDVAEQTASYYQKEKHDKELQERRRIEKERSEEVFNLWLLGTSMKDIAIKLNISLSVVRQYLENAKQKELSRGLATFSDAGKKNGFDIPIYNIWKQQKKSDTPDHFGNSEVRWVENLLYLYTKPFDMVVDLFAGSGSTIDICRKRSRRYWVSDRLPIPERESEIRKWDVTEGLPSIDWGNVKLVYLDPPYWKQAEGKYSKDPTDLANMELESFNNTLSGLIMDISKKLNNAYIALIIQPTQWNSPDQKYTDHVIDMICQVKLPINIRISTPYESQQCTPQMVEWSKNNRRLLVLSREIIVWKVGV